MDGYHRCTKKATTRQYVVSGQPYGVWLSFDFQLWESNDYVTIRSMQGSSKQGVGGSIVHAEVGDHVRVNIRIDDSENEYRGREGYVVSLYSDNSRDSYVMNDAEQMTGDDVPSHAVYVLLDGDDVATSFSTKEVTNYSLRRRRASHTIAERPCRMGRPRLLHQEKMPVTVLVDRHIWSDLGKFVDMGRAPSKNAIVREALRRYSAALEAELATGSQETSETA